MVTLKVQRWPIPDYFMAYFLQHPEGNANIYRIIHSSQPGPTGTATLPPATVRRHCTCLPAAHLQPSSPIKYPQRSQIVSNFTPIHFCTLALSYMCFTWETFNLPWHFFWESNRSLFLWTVNFNAWPWPVMFQSSQRQQMKTHDYSFVLKHFTPKKGLNQRSFSRSSFPTHVL